MIDLEKQILIALGYYDTHLPKKEDWKAQYADIELDAYVPRLKALCEAYAASKVREVLMEANELMYRHIQVSDVSLNQCEFFYHEDRQLRLKKIGSMINKDYNGVTKEAGDV